MANEQNTGDEINRQPLNDDLCELERRLASLGPRQAQLSFGPLMYQAGLDAARAHHRWSNRWQISTGVLALSTIGLAMALWLRPAKVVYEQVLIESPNREKSVAEEFIRKPATPENQDLPNSASMFISNSLLHRKIALHEGVDSLPAPPATRETSSPPITVGELRRSWGRRLLHPFFDQFMN